MVAELKRFVFLLAAITHCWQLWPHVMWLTWWNSTGTADHSFMSVHLWHQSRYSSLF